MIVAMIIPSEAAIAAATLTARRARLALPAPSSFDTLVLRVHHKIAGKLIRKMEEITQ